MKNTNKILLSFLLLVVSSCGKVNVSVSESSEVLPEINVTNDTIFLLNTSYVDYDIGTTISTIGNYFVDFSCQGVISSAKLDETGKVLVSVDENISQYTKNGSLVISLTETDTDTPITKTINFTQAETNYLLTEYAIYDKNDNLKSKEVYEYENGEIKYTYIYEKQIFGTEVVLSCRESNYIDPENGDRVYFIESPSSQEEGKWVNNAKHVTSTIYEDETGYSYMTIDYAYNRTLGTWEPMTGHKITTDSINGTYEDIRYNYSQGEQIINSKYVSTIVNGKEEKITYYPNKTTGEFELSGKEEKYVEDDYNYDLFYKWNGESYDYNFGYKSIYEEHANEIGNTLKFTEYYKNTSDSEFNIDYIETTQFDLNNQVIEEIVENYNNGEVTSGNHCIYEYDQRDLLTRVNIYNFDGQFSSGEETLDKYGVYTYQKA